MLNRIVHHNLKIGILWYLWICLHLSHSLSTETENEVSSALGRRRTPRSMTTICVEIKPSGPKEEPYYMCKGTAEEQAVSLSNEQIPIDQANYGSVNPLVSSINQQFPLQYFPDQLNSFEKPWKAVTPIGLSKNPASQSILANGYQDFQWSPALPPTSYFHQSQQQQFGNANPGEEFMHYHQTPPQSSLSTNPHQLPTQPAHLPSSQFPSPEQNRHPFHSHANNHYFPQSSPQQIVPQNKPNHGYFQDQRPNFQNLPSYGMATPTNQQHSSATGYSTPSNSHDGTGLQQSQHPFGVTATKNGPGHGASVMTGPNGFSNDAGKHFGGIFGNPNNLAFPNSQPAALPITQQISTVPSVHRTAAAAMSTAMADLNPTSRPEATFSNSPKPTGTLKNDYELTRSSNGSQRVNDQRSIADERKSDDLDQLRYRPLTQNKAVNGHRVQSSQGISRANKFAKPMENQLEPNQLSLEQQQQQHPSSMFGFSEQEFDNLSPVVGAALNQPVSKPKSRPAPSDFSESAARQHGFDSMEQPPGDQEDAQLGASLSHQSGYNSYPAPHSNNYYNPRPTVPPMPAVSPIHPVNTVQSPAPAAPGTVCMNNHQQQQPCMIVPPSQPLQCNTNGLVQIGPQWNPPYNYNIQPLLIGLPFYGQQQQQQQQQQRYAADNLLSDAGQFERTNSPTGFLGASPAFGVPILGLTNTFGWVNDKILSAQKPPMQCPRTSLETTVSEASPSKTEGENGIAKNAVNETNLETNRNAKEDTGLDIVGSKKDDNNNATVLVSSTRKVESEMDTPDVSDNQKKSDEMKLEQNLKTANSTSIERKEKEAIESSVPMEEETKRTFHSLLEMAQKAKQLNNDELGRIKHKANKTRVITFDRVKN